MRVTEGSRSPILGTATDIFGWPREGNSRPGRFLPTRAEAAEHEHRAALLAGVMPARLWCDFPSPSSSLPPISEPTRRSMSTILQHGVGALRLELGGLRQRRGYCPPRLGGATNPSPTTADRLRRPIVGEILGQATRQTTPPHQEAPLVHNT
jgi:hypothetical protein